MKRHALRVLVGYVRRHHVALLALFVALGGTAWAAQKAPKDSVVSRSIKDGQVKARDVKLTKTYEYPQQVNLGPSSSAAQDPFTVRVPSSGLVSVWAEAEISKSSGQANFPCSVSLSLTGAAPYVPILQIGIDFDGFSTRRTAPNSDNEGVFTPTQAGYLTFPAEPGKQTFRISYSSFTNTNCQFRNTKLVVQPVP